MAIFIILCMAIVMADEAAKKHGNLKQFIENLKKVEE
jgi:hypothetical protein